jgi:hypothetical protein
MSMHTRVSRRPTGLLQGNGAFFIVITSKCERMKGVAMISCALAAQGGVLYTSEGDVAKRGDGSIRTMINVARQFALT